MLNQRNVLKVAAAGNDSFFSQNGVVGRAWGFKGDNGSHWRGASAASAAEAPRPAIARPKNLQVTTVLNGYAAKGRRDDGAANGCSLPSGGDGGSDDASSVCSAADEGLESVTRQLIFKVLADITSHAEPSWNEDKAVTTMKRVVNELLQKHNFAYNGMVKKLSLVPVDDAKFLGDVSKSLFDDGTTNWGRVASLVAFGAVVCKYLRDRDGDARVTMVGDEIASYLLTHQRDWLVKNNSWDGFVEFFQVADPESTVRKTLIGLVGFAGIGATLALLLR